MTKAKNKTLGVNNIVIFGTGNHYLKYKKYFKDVEIIALLDNSPKKIGTRIDGVEVISPNDVLNIDYDRIYILSFYWDEMTEQLLDIGVKREDIYYYFDISELDVNDVYKPNNVPKRSTNTKSIAVISDDLKISGAQSVLMDAVSCMKCADYQVTVASPVHGKMEGYFNDMQVPLIIDERIAIGTLNDLEWLDGYDMIFINTVTFFHLLLRRDFNIPVFFWLHEPELLYGDKFRSKIREIRADNLYVYAVSQFAIDAWEKYSDNIRAGLLTIGRADIEDVNRKENEDQSRGVIYFLMVGAIGDLKGQDIVCNALSLLNENYLRQIHVRIIGRRMPRYDITFLDSWIEQNVISVVEEMPSEELAHEYEHSDVLLCASKAESLSAVVIEAMQYNVPSIVSDAAGIIDYLRDGEDAIIFRSENAEALAEKLMWCVDNRDKLQIMGQKARKIYEREFTLEVFDKNLLQCIEDIIG